MIFPRSSGYVYGVFNRKINSKVRQFPGHQNREKLDFLKYKTRYKNTPKNLLKHDELKTGTFLNCSIICLHKF